jgi:hypothetical protein
MKVRSYRRTQPESSRILFAARNSGSVDGTTGQISLGVGQTDNQGAFEFNVKIPDTMCTVVQGQLHVASTRDDTALTAPLAVYSDRC